MKALVNTTTLVKGGAIQVAATFIAQCAQTVDTDMELIFAVSPQVQRALGNLDLPAGNNVILFDQSPAKSRLHRRRLRSLAEEVKADVVFTVFGPSYVRFNMPHLCGMADGWVTHASWLAFSSLHGWRARLTTLLRCLYKAYWIRFADYWVVEADCARHGMSRRLGIPASKISVVPNTCAPVFHAAKMPAAFPSAGEVVRLMYVAADYPHKNIDMVAEVAAALKTSMPERGFRFLLTLPEDSTGLARVRALAERYGVADRIVNLGELTHEQIVDQYGQAHLCFFPSLLETFSAAYPEAMALGRPIVTSDLDFARSVCGAAAIYFNPHDPVAAAKAIEQLLASEELWFTCVTRGHQVLAALPDPAEKARLYLQLVRKTAQSRDTG